MHTPHPLQGGTALPIFAEETVQLMFRPTQVK